MKYLIINSLPEDELSKTVNSFAVKTGGIEIFDLNKYKIGNCLGCTNCWLKNPGVCCVNDDWEIMFKKFLKSDCIIFITESRLGFISHKMKNIVDRLVPLGLPYTKLSKGEMRHPVRYNKLWKIGLLYSGSGNREFLNEWMKRFALNLSSISLGAYNINEKEELLREIDNL